MTKIIELADGLLKFGLLIGGMTLFNNLLNWYDKKMEWEAIWKKYPRETER